MIFRVATSVRDIVWLAGFMEGEAAFIYRRASGIPMISVSSIDLDVITRVSSIVGTKVLGPRMLKSGKPFFTIELTGSRAVQWMLTLFTELSARRRKQIKLAIDAWPARNVGAQLGHKGHGPVNTRIPKDIMEILYGNS